MVSSRSDHPTPQPPLRFQSRSRSPSRSPSRSRRQSRRHLQPQSPTSPPSSRFPPLSQPNPSSVSLVSSTAQGRPIPLSHANAANRTIALRELNRSQPATRHPYTKPSGPPPSAAGIPPATTTGTYSQPVLVRTYSGSIPSSATARSTSRRDTTPSARDKPGTPSTAGTRRHHGLAITLMRPLVSRKPSPVDEAKLPPLEAFSFRSIMTEIESDISADLDRIADICARSRYSLSNQYEIHVAPHGSGNSFVQTAPASASTNPPGRDNGGPTLQAISIDDEHLSISHGRRALARQGNTAYGTLETIISSSRSSEEDRSKRKSAAEIATQVRGRASQLSLGGCGSAHSTEAQASSEHRDGRTKKSPRIRATLAAAILDHSRAQTRRKPDLPSPRTSGTLVGEPAIPETSHSHLLSTTTSEGLSREDGKPGPSSKEQTSVSVSKSVVAAAIAVPEEPKDQPSLLSGLRFSVPWKGISVIDTSSTEQKPGRRPRSYAEGTLRQLLRSTDSSENRGGKFASGDGEAAG